MRGRGCQVKGTGKIIPGKRNNTCKGPEVGMGLVFSRDRMLPQDSEPKGRVVESKIG